MEKSIEDMWKEGFLENNALVAPKVNNLYSQKSRNLIDKIKDRMNKYFMIMLVLSVGFFASILVTGIPVVLGLCIFLFFAGLAG